MKVQELRQLASASDREHLEKALVECYKLIRKAQKEEFDPVITGILEGKEVEKKIEGAVSFEELEQQIPVFLQNAYAQNYFAPNRVIPKNQRPKWRFMVKNYIKVLEKIAPESENYPKAVKMLTDLYCLICDACNYYLFSTDDPFRSIGWEQPDLFALVVKKTFAAGYSRESISHLLLKATTGGVSRECLKIQQELVLLGGLRTSDVKYMAIEEAQKLIGEREGKLAGLKKYDDRRYGLQSAIDELCIMILIISIDLAEPETGVEYFFEHVKDRDREITLYRALNVVEWMEDDDLWIEVYKYGLMKKIDPRDSLKAMYNEKKRQKEDAGSSGKM